MRLSIAADVRTQVVLGLAMLFLQQVSSAQLPGGQKLSLRIDRIFAEFTRPGSPGCAVAVSRAGAMLHSRAYGLANLEDTVPLRPTSVFYAASISKQFTGTVIALLLAEGRVRLEDDVRRYLPELPDYARLHGKPIRLRHLIYHTSGIRDYDALFDLAGWPADGVYTVDDVLALIARQEALNFNPGDEYAYSSSGYFLLAEVVRRVSGEPLRSFAERRIFKPLGMAHTAYRDDHTLVVPGRAIGYAPRKGGGYGLAQPNFDLVGGGGAMTTVADLVRWAANFDDPRIGGPELVARVTNPGTLDNGDPVPYGFGVFVTEHNGRLLLSHPGGYLGYQAALLRFPADRVVIAVLCNIESSTPYGYALRIADLVSETPAALSGGAGPEALSKPNGTTLAAPQLERWAGVYRNLQTEELRQVGTADGRLRQQLALFTHLTRSQELIPLSPHRFRVAGAPVEIQFSSAAAGDPDRTHLRIVHPGRRGTAADEFVRTQLVDPTRVRPGQYLGEYENAEVEIRYRVVQSGDSLTLVGPGKVQRTLRPTVADGFISADGWVVQFGPRGRTQRREFVLTTDRVRRLVFRKVASWPRDS
jgi:CubicO group peptidase (beta-lactamase class C family)